MTFHDRGISTVQFMQSTYPFVVDFDFQTRDAEKNINKRECVDTVTEGAPKTPDHVNHPIDRLARFLESRNELAPKPVSRQQPPSFETSSSLQVEAMYSVCFTKFAQENLILRYLHSRTTVTSKFRTDTG